ncbi:MAG: SpoIIE family protein phosphatase [Cyanobacteria bacterium SID2]|nr:SpoIIE family protein phosphatase [Cyanobacteria bacterium SID2]MBP0002643.1 SpoIIE family protein phosphatase [Cyanobacteria bacterium SBC]
MLESKPLAKFDSSSLETLHLDSTLQDLSLYEFEIEVSSPGSLLVETFSGNPLLPGVILIENNSFFGMISRRHFLEIMSRPYGIELFSRRPIQALYDFIRTDILCCSGDTPIFDAARRCLQRSPELLYEPIVVALDDRSYRLLDVHKLLIAQSRLYELATLLLRERTDELDRANAEVMELNERLKAENLRLGAEVEVARKLQQMLLPTEKDLERIPELDIAGYMEPADEVGGDYYDILPHSGGVKIGIGDVTGHGLESGVLTIMVQTAIRTLLATKETDPVRFLSTLNRTIYDNVQRMNSDRYLTLAVLDYCQGELRLSGQHEDVLIVRRGGTIERIDTVDLGFPIGLDRHISDFISEVSVRLQPGDTVILYTDGITEAENEDGDLYGLDRLRDIARCHWDKSAREIRQAIVGDVRQYIGNQKVYDDITLLVLKQKT